MLSIIKLVQTLARSGIRVGINTMKSPLIHQARNYLTSVFLTTQYEYLLFIDSDVEFEPEAVVRMLVMKKDIVCTPYRVKSPQLDKSIYTVEFKDPENIVRLAGGRTEIIGGVVEIEAGPTGLMLIDRRVFMRILQRRPDLKIKNKATPTVDKSHEFYYNFFDFGFKDGYAIGEDISFCQLVRKNNFKIYANTESTTKHHGSYAWEGQFGKSLNGRS